MPGSKKTTRKKQKVVHRLLMCPEPRCGFKADREGCRSHWYSTHKQRGQRCPRFVETSSSDEDEGREESEEKRDYDSAIDIIHKHIEGVESRAVASKLYQRFFRHPRVVNAEVVFHTICLDTNTMQPMVKNSDIDRFVSVMKAVILGEKEEEDGRAPVAASADSGPEKTHEEAPLPERAEDSPPPRKRRRLTTSCDKSVQTRLEDMLIEMKSYQGVLEYIQTLDCEDTNKDALRHKAHVIMGIYEENSAPPPPVVIKDMVKEYLGYTPRRVHVGKNSGRGQDASELYRAIGKAVRRSYLERYKREPQKRQFSFGDRLVTTNNYSREDRVWIAEIVQRQCKEALAFPRPKVAMARGEEIIHN